MKWRVRDRKWENADGVRRGWQVDLIVGKTRKRLMHPGPKSAAETWAVQALAALASGASLPPIDGKEVKTAEAPIMRSQARHGNVTLSQAWEDFAQNVLRGHADTTRKIREQQWKWIAPVLGERLVQEIDDQTLQGLWTELISGSKRRTTPKLSPKSAKEAVKFARQLAARIDRLRLIRLPPMKVPDSDLPHWSLDEIDQITEALTKPLFRVAFLLMARTGLRIGEIRGLQWCDVDEAKQVIRVERQLTDAKELRAPKHGRKRPVYVPSDALQAIRSLPRRGMFVFALEDTGMPPVRQYFAREITGACEKAGVRKGTNHAARRSFATEAAELGIPTTAIRDGMGHTSTTTTDGYIRKVTGGEVRRDFEALARTGTRKLAQGQGPNSDPSEK